MKHTRKAARLIAVASLGLAWIGCGGFPETKPLEFQDLLQTKRPDELQLSQDGRLLAFVQATNDLHADVPLQTLWLLELSNGALTRVTQAGAAVRLPNWSPDGQQLAFLAGDAHEQSSLDLLTLPDLAARPLLQVAGLTSLTWSPDGARLAFTAPSRPPSSGFELSVVEVSSGATRVLLDDLDAAEGAEWSPDGHSIALTAVAPASSGQEPVPSIQVVDAQTGARRQVSPEGIHSEGPRWSPDSARLAFLLFPGETLEEQALAVGKLAVVSADGGESRVVAPDFPYLPEKIFWSADGQTLLFETFTGETGQLFTVPASGGTPVPFTREEGIVYRATYSRDRSVMAVVRESPVTPPEVWVSPGPPHFDPVQRTDFNAKLRAFPMGDAEVVSWTSSDGLQVSGILVHPVGERKGERAPLLVDSHGGPFESVVMQWMDSWLLAGAQQWANRGWAVFFPNYRGSIRHGQAFANALIGQVGKGDFADVMSGVDALISRGIADPDHLAHTGWSYGGFLSGWIETHTQRFKAIVAGAGPYNWAEQFEQATDPASMLVVSILFQGTPAERPQAYREASVSTFIANARTPALVMYGDQDTTVAISQPQGLHAALAEEGVTTDLVVFAGEPHVLIKPSDQLTKLQREQEWIVHFTTRASEPWAPRLRDCAPTLGVCGH